jgi:hypothetical protein
MVADNPSFKSDHPVRSIKEASRHLLDVADTPPHEEGITLDSSFFNSFTQFG